VRPSANVSSIDALRDFKRGLTEFGAIAIAAIDEAQADVQRAVWWVQHDQLAYWKNQRKKRETKLQQARSELFRAEVASPEMKTTALAERKAVERAERALEEADTKIEAVKRWARFLDREVVLYKGQVQPLAFAVEGELPRAVSRLEKLTTALERYVQLAAPAPADEPVEPAGDEP